VSVVFSATLCSASASFEASEDIIVNGEVVIAKGAVSRGEVIEAQPNRSFGRSGKLNFTIDVVQAINGENVRLRGVREREGENSYGKAGVITILTGPFGVFVRGKDVEVEAGTAYTIYIDEDRPITLP
jgi:hypothetical protein